MEKESRARNSEAAPTGRLEGMGEGDVIESQKAEHRAHYLETTNDFLLKDTARFRRLSMKRIRAIVPWPCSLSSLFST